MKDSAYEIAGNPKYYWYQNGLASMVFSFFDKKTRSVAKASVNEELAQELHKPVIKKFKSSRVYARFKAKMWAVDLVKMRSKWVLNIYYV